MVAVVILCAGFIIRRHLSQWTAIGDGLSFQSSQSNSENVITYKTSPDENVSKLVPSLWVIQKPFSSKPKYTTQHQEQLQEWWAPLAKKYSGLEALNQKIKSIRYAPNLGIYVEVKVTKKEKNLHNPRLLEFVAELRDTWQPRKLDFDNTSAVRLQLLRHGDWLIAAILFMLLHNSALYQYVSFFHDTYYLKIGFVMALLGAASLISWFYPKFEGSAWRKTALLQIALASGLALAITIPYALIYTNMAYTRTICETNAPVKNWIAKSGKSKSYHAILDVTACSFTGHNEVQLRVPYNVYTSKAAALPVKIGRGVLGRYMITTK